MEQFEKRADSLLRAVERRYQVKVALARSTRLKTLEDFKTGDPITITLENDCTDDELREDGGIISGTIADPNLGLITVAHNTTGLSNIEGKLIGLAVDITETAPTGEEMRLTHHGHLAGNRRFAYYLADSLTDSEAGEHPVDDSVVLHPALAYSRAAVLGTILFDFITAVENL